MTLIDFSTPLTLTLGELILSIIRPSPSAAPTVTDLQKGQRNVCHKDLTACGSIDSQI